MALDGALGEDEAAGDCVVGQTLGHQREHLSGDAATAEEKGRELLEAVQRFAKTR